MRTIFLLGWLFVAQVSMAANETAYSALRVFGKREGEKALYRVIELRGRSGAPQPAAWKLLIDDPKARGGVREIELQRGRIVSERTPVGRRDLGAPMNFNQLNLDSDGVFTVVNQEAQKRRVPFDRVDYVLHTGNSGGAPVWDVELFDGGTERVGTMRVGADTGEIIEQNLTGRVRNFEEEDRAFVEQPGPDPERRREYREDSEGGATLPDFFDRVGRHFQKRGRQLENFFTGKRH